MKYFIGSLLYLLAGICYGESIATTDRKKWGAFYAIGTFFWLIGIVLMY